MEESKEGRFEVYQDRAGEWRWRLLAGNYRIVANGHDGYTTEAGAEEAVSTVVRLMEVVVGREG